MRAMQSASRRTAPPKRIAVEVEPVFRVPPDATTLAGFRVWSSSDNFPQTGNIAFIGGELFFDMSPERLDSHNKVKTEILRVVATLAIEEDLGEAYSDRTRIVNADADLSCEPDGALVSWKSFETGRVKKIPTVDNVDFIELEGSPDWVMEIISPSSEIKDLKDLKDRYHRAGIREYWLIDARGDKVRFQILIHHGAGYVEVSPVRSWVRSRVFGRSFRLKRFKDRLETWSYRLEVKK